MLHTNILINQNQKNAIQKFIVLAHQCKMLNNYQTEYTIISTFSAVDISKMGILWKLVETRYRDIYTAPENEYHKCKNLF